MLIDIGMPFGRSNVTITKAPQVVDFEKRKIKSRYRMMAANPALFIQEQAGAIQKDYADTVQKLQAQYQSKIEQAMQSAKSYEGLYNQLLEIKREYLMKQQQLENKYATELERIQNVASSSSKENEYNQILSQPFESQEGLIRAIIHNEAIKGMGISENSKRGILATIDQIAADVAQGNIRSPSDYLKAQEVETDVPGVKAVIDPISGQVTGFRDQNLGMSLPATNENVRGIYSRSRVFAHANAQGLKVEASEVSGVSAVKDKSGRVVGFYDLNRGMSLPASAQNVAAYLTKKPVPTQPAASPIVSPAPVTYSSRSGSGSSSRTSSSGSSGSSTISQQSGVTVQKEFKDESGETIGYELTGGKYGEGMSIAADKVEPAPTSSPVPSYSSISPYTGLKLW